MPEPSFEWHPEVLPPGWKRTAVDLATRSTLAGFYLAGGTGMALQVGHRRSVDLDLFTEGDFDATNLRGSLRGLDELRDVETAPGTLHLTLHGLKVSFLHYSYPLLFPTRRFEPLTVADPRDIACMKLEAIAGRGSRRDFVDLYMAARTYGLREILEWARTKYAAVPYNRIHLLKALTYFKDAEQEPMPDMLLPLDWSIVRQFFLTEVPRLPREF